jgi:hypothetical protein
VAVGVGLALEGRHAVRSFERPPPGTM